MAYCRIIRFVRNWLELREFGIDNFKIQDREREDFRPDLNIGSNEFLESRDIDPPENGKVC